MKEISKTHFLFLNLVLFCVFKVIYASFGIPFTSLLKKSILLMYLRLKMFIVCFANFNLEFGPPVAKSLCLHSFDNNNICFTVRFKLS